MLRGIHAALLSAPDSIVTCKHTRRTLLGVRCTSSFGPGERKAPAFRRVRHESNHVQRAEHRHDGSQQLDRKSLDLHQAPSRSRRYDNAWVERIDFYDWFLNKKIKYDKISLPGSWIALLNRHSLRRAVPEALVLDPLAILSRANESPAALENCLELFIAQTESGTDSREERQAQYVRAEPGRRALLWYTEHSHQVDLLLHPRLTRAITHCLFAEQREEILWRWLGTDDLVLANPGLSIDQRCGWRAKLFRYSVEAAAFWSSKATYMDDSVRIFMSAIDRFYTERSADSQLDPMYLPKSGAGIWLLRQLVSGPPSTSTEAAFDIAVDRVVSCWDRDPVSREYTRAQLALRHPVRPDPHPSLHFIQRHEDPNRRPPGVQDIFSPKHQASASAVFYYLIETAQLLNKQGLTDEARWTLDFGRENLPAYFTPGFRRGYQTTGSTDIRRFERGRTSQTDSDGRTIQSERQLKASRASDQIDPRRWKRRVG